MKKSSHIQSNNFKEQSMKTYAVNFEVKYNEVQEIDAENEYEVHNILRERFMNASDVVVHYVDEVPSYAYE